MILPPITPLKREDKGINYFQQLAILTSSYLKEWGVVLNFN